MVQSYLSGCANVPSHVGTLAPPGEYDWTCASIGPTESTIQRTNQSVQSFLHSSQQKVPMLYNGRAFPQKLALPLLMEASGRHLICNFLGHSEPTIQTASRSVQKFSHWWLQSVPILYNGRPYPPKLSLPMGYLEPNLTFDFLGPIQAHNPNSISMGSAVFAQMTAEYPYTLHLDAPFPLKVPLPRGIWTPT